MTDVFISYSRTDQALVARLARAVEAEGYEVWWDAELPPHQSYGDVITARIAEAKAAIVVWSAEAVKSEWVRAEADMARNQKKLVQTAIDSIMPPLPFNQIQYATIGDWQGEADHPGWRKVKASLTDLCGKRETVPTAYPVPSAPPPVTPPPPAAAPEPAVSALQPSKWPLFAGIGVAAVAIALAAGFVLGERGGREEDEKLVAEVVEAEKAAGPAQQPAAQPAAKPVAPPVAQPAPEPKPVEAAEPAPGPPEKIPEAAYAPHEMTFPHSSTRLLTPAEIAGLGPATLRIARNEIYARKGRRFLKPEMRDYFSQFSWYQPRFAVVRLNAIEQRNVALLSRAEARFGGGAGE